MQSTLNPLALSTFSCVLGDWLGAETREVKTSSRCAYRTVTVTHILPELGSLPPTELTAQQLEEFLRRKSTELAPSTVRIIAAVLRGALVKGASVVGLYNSTTNTLLYACVAAA